MVLTTLLPATACLIAIGWNWYGNGLISFAHRSYRVGDLMKPLHSAAELHRDGGLVLIVREAGHSRYFYGLVCSTGKEHLLSLEDYCGVFEEW